VTGAEGGVAGAENDEVAVESTVGVEVAAGYDVGGPGEELYGQEGKGSGGSGELDVGGWGEEAALVQPIERFAIEGGDADAEGGVAQGWIGEYNLNAVSDLAGGWGGSGGWFGGAILGLREDAGQDQGCCENGQESSPKGIHAGSLAGCASCRHTIESSGILKRRRAVKNYKGYR
jgi:hypothetical protein